MCPPWKPKPAQGPVRSILSCGSISIMLPAHPCRGIQQGGKRRARAAAIARPSLRKQRCAGTSGGYAAFRIMYIMFSPLQQECLGTPLTTSRLLHGRLVTPVRVVNCSLRTWHVSVQAQHLLLTTAQPLALGVAQLLPAVAQSPHCGPAHAGSAQPLCLRAAVSRHAHNLARRCWYALATRLTLDQRPLDVRAVAAHAQIDVLLASEWFSAEIVRLWRRRPMPGQRLRTRRGANSLRVLRRCQQQKRHNQA